MSKKKQEQDCVCTKCIAAEMVESTATGVLRHIQSEFHVCHKGFLEHLSHHERLLLAHRILATVSLQLSLLTPEEMIPVREDDEDEEVGS